MQRDSIANTLIVSVLLCLFCSLIVSTASIQLRSKQKTNAEEYRKRNVLLVAGLDVETIKKEGGVEKIFGDRVQDLLIDLDTGKDGTARLVELMQKETKNPKLSESEALQKYSPLKVAKNAGSVGQTEGLATPFGKDMTDVAGLGKGRENFAHVYRYQGPESAEPVWIFPVRGRGLWSTLHGFMALQSDLKTMEGITFYEHGETPGLGGEVENPSWKAKWPGKQVYKQDGSVGLKVIKGSAEPSDPYAIDGLSGATITSTGVSNIVKFWMGEHGFGKFIDANKPSSVTASGGGQPVKAVTR